MKTSRRGIALVLALFFWLTPMGSIFSAAKATVIPYFLNQFEGTSLNLKQYWGKAYLLFFFTEASQDCAKQFPEIKRVYESYSKEELQILLIHVWDHETEENTRRVINQYGLEGMTFFEDKDQEVAQKIGIPGCPVTLFMDAAGYLYDVFVYPADYEMMAEVVDAMAVTAALPTTPAPLETIPVIWPLPGTPEPTPVGIPATDPPA